MLKFYCLLTGDQYSLVSEDTPQSKQKVMLLANTLLIPVLMWTIIGFLLSYKVLGCSMKVSIVVSAICAFLIFLVERIIILSTSNTTMKWFRVTLGVVVAFIGAIALDEVVFKEDIDHQLAINKEVAADAAKLRAERSFDSLHNMKATELAIANAKNDYDQAEMNVKLEAEGKGSGNKGVGKITKMHQDKARERKILWEAAQVKYDTLLAQRAAAVEKAADKIKAEYKDGLLVRIKALFQMVFSSWLMGIVYLAFTIFMFCLEFIVVLVKMNTPESNYERRVKLIEEIGQRRMQMLKEAPSPLVDPSYSLPNAVAAREALNKTNQSLYN